jgi:sarcosine oxidase
MKRRAVAQLLLASTIVSRVARAGQAPAVNHRLPDIIVVGAGSFGAWTAHALRSEGHHVTLIDAYGPANSRASSGDESRIIRMSYGSQSIYTAWAKESLVAWQGLSERTRQPVFERAGALVIGAQHGAYLRDSEEALKQNGIRYELLDAATCKRRFGQFALSSDEIALFEPDSGALRARRGIQLLVAEMRTGGLDYRSARVRPLDRESGKLDSITTENGDKLSAAAYVYACGPWLPKLVPGVLGEALRTPRAEVYYFGAAAGDESFESAHFPCWFDVASPTFDAFGIPDLDYRGMKIGVDAYDEPADPDRQDRISTPRYLEATREYLRRRFPELAEAPVIESRVCQYEMTPSENYVLDRHPGVENLWIAGGGSGHGFKNGPAVGRYVAHILRGGAANPVFSFAALETSLKKSGQTSFRSDVTEG